MSMISLPSPHEAKKLDALRAKRASIVADLAALRRLSPTEAEVRQRIEQDIERIRFANPVLSLNIADSARELPHASAQRVLALVLRLVGEDRAVEVLIAEEAERRPFGTVTREQRDARERDLRNKLVEIERAEEVEVCRLEDLGHSVVRRGDVDGRLVVEVWRELYGAEDADAGAAA